MLWKNQALSQKLQGLFTICSHALPNDQFRLQFQYKACIIISGLFYFTEVILLDINQTPDSTEKKCTRDVAVLGILLIIFHFTAKYLGYVFYYVSYAVLSGSVTLSWSEVRSYFSGKADLVNSTAFQMSANISISAAAVLITLLVAGLAFKTTVWSCLKTDKQGAKTGVKWLSPCFVFNMLASTVISFVTGFLGSMGVSVPTADFSIRQPSAFAVIMQIAYIVILAPVFEEVIYRGLIIKVISPYSKTAAVFVSALAFGLMHGNIPQAASAFCTGLIYAIIALKCGSIIPTVIIHSLNNLIVNSPELAGAVGIPYNRTVLSVIEVCIGLFGFFMWLTSYKYLKYDDTPPSEEKKLAVKRVFTNPMLLIYFGILLFVIAKRIVEANM